MKTKTKNRLIAAFAVAAVLSAGVGVAVLSNSNNDFATEGLNLNGDYSLTAFAEASSAKTINVDGVNLDVTSTKYITSTDNKYQLYVSAIDVEDTKKLANVRVGYTYNGKKYNGEYSETESGLSIAVYSTLTIGNTTLSVQDMFSNALSSAGTFADAKLVITEVAVAEGAAIAELTVTGVNPVVATHNFTTDDKNSSFFTINGSLSSSKGTVNYDGLTLTQCLKMESSTNVTFTLDVASKITLVLVEPAATIKIDGTKYTAENGDGVISVDLAAGAHTLTKADSANLFYIKITKAVICDGHTYTPSKIEWVWSGTSATATILCDKCNAENKLVVDVTSEVTTNSEGQSGTLYTASTTLNDKVYSDTKFVEEGTSTSTVQTWMFTNESTSDSGGTLSNYGITLGTNGTTKFRTKEVNTTVNNVSVSNALQTSGGKKTVTVNATEGNVKVTLYVASTNSGADTLKSANFTVSGATNGNGTFATNSAIISIEVILNKNATCSIVLSSDYTTIYMIEVESIA